MYHLPQPHKSNVEGFPFFRSHKLFLFYFGRVFWTPAKKQTLSDNFARFIHLVMSNVMMKVLFVCAALCFMFHSLYAGAAMTKEKEILQIGLLLPYSQGWTVGQSIGGAILVAIEKVELLRILPHHEIRYRWADTSCAAYDGIHGVLDLYTKYAKPDVFIGGGCSVVCEPVALISAVWNLPQISWGCNSPDLSDKLKYPTFSRTVGPWVFLAPVVGDLMDTFGWNRAAIVATSEHIMQLTANAFRDELLGRDIGVYRHDLKTVVDHSKIVVERMGVLEDVVGAVKAEARS